MTVLGLLTVMIVSGCVQNISSDADPCSFALKESDLPSHYVLVDSGQQEYDYIKDCSVVYRSLETGTVLMNDILVYNQTTVETMKATGDDVGAEDNFDIIRRAVDQYVYTAIPIAEKIGTDSILIKHQNAAGEHIYDLSSYRGNVLFGVHLRSNSTDSPDFSPEKVVQYALIVESRI